MADVNEALFAVVTWHDTHSEPDWMDLEHLDQDPYAVKSAGWLIPDAKRDHVVLVQSIGSDDQVDSVLSIPLGMVIKVSIVNRTDLR
jgi:hypothetical protein